MSFKSVSKTVIEIAQDARNAGQTIDINYGMPTVAIEMPAIGESYFFQGEEASNLINEAETSKLAKYCSVADIILWNAQSW